MGGMFHVRPIEPEAAGEVALVAARMRATLAEVLGPARGEAMYDLAWLEARVRWHLDPAACTGAVFVAVDGAGAIAGHTIVRREVDGDGRPFGLFSTTYVAPEARHGGAATALLRAGEAWMRARGLAEAVTYTHPGNEKLQRLYAREGYAPAPVDADFVRLARAL